VILAVVAAVPSYVVSYRLIEAYHARDVDVVGTVTDAVSGDEDQPTGPSTTRSRE